MTYRGEGVMDREDRIDLMMNLGEEVDKELVETIMSSEARDLLDGKS